MSVPTHNLYEFVHQVTEKKYLLRYFYPWGSRNTDQIIDHVVGNDDYRQQFVDVVSKKLFGSGSIYFNWTHFQPVLFCHDQEPLNFNLYNNSRLNLRHFKNGDGTRNVSHVKKWILLHSEEDSKDLELYKQSGLFTTAHWWCHAMISLDWFRFAQYDKNLGKTNTKKTFLIYARGLDGSRQYRQTFLEMIPHNICQIGSFIEENISSESSAVYNAYDHTHTDLSVILETVVDRVHLTEKTCRAIVCKHPFLLVAGVGSLKYLKRYGFKTFEPLIDESYDEQHDLQKRMQMIVEQMHKINNFDEMQMIQLKEIAEYNHKRFFSNEFFEELINELVINISDAYDYNLNIESMWRHYSQNKKTNEKYVKRRPYILSLIKHLKKGSTLEDYVPPDLD